MAIGRQIGLRTQLKNYDDRCVAVGNWEGMINHEFYEYFSDRWGSDSGRDRGCYCVLRVLRDSDCLDVCQKPSGADGGRVRR